MIRNLVTSAEAEVGSKCVSKFMGVNSHLIFNAQKRIIDDNTKALNSEAIEYYYGKKMMDAFEYKFYLDTMHRQDKHLSPKQSAIRMRVNRRIVASFSR